MDNDDRPIGRVLSRREALLLLGMAGTAALAAACTPAATAAPTSATATTATTSAATATAEGAVPTQTLASGVVTTPTCVVRPEVTEGPYYVDEDLVRSDIRTDPSNGAVSEGTPLVLTFAVAQITDSAACTALPGATIDVWHCDANGVYSDVADPGFDTSGQKFLRGSQVTDANGLATFTTIYPGWYSGRTVHIHFKVRPSDSLVFTSQLFFDDTLTDEAFTVAPYAGKGARNTRNSNDGIYEDTLLLTMTKTDTGYAATFPIGVDLSTLGDGSNAGGGPGGGGPGGPGGPP